MVLGRRNLKITFNLMCIITVGCMAGYWLHKYKIIDRDIGVVDYVQIEEANDEVKLFVTSICFQDPFIEKNLEELSLDVNLTTYGQYLHGKLYHERLSRVNYSNVTLNLKDFFLFSSEKWRNESGFKNNTLRPEFKVVYNGFYRNRFLKCFDLISDMEPYRHISEAYFYYNVQKMMEVWSSKVNFPQIYFKIHYPGEFILGEPPSRYSFDLFRSQISVYLQIIVNEIEILQSRPTRKRRCEENAEDYDKMVLKEHIRKKGCKDPYLEMNGSFSTCDNKEKIKSNRFEYDSPYLLGIPNACKRFSKIRLDARTLAFVPRMENKFWGLAVFYPKEVRIITQSKEVDIHSLIGNVGGYLGLFLGKLSFSKFGFPM